MYFRGKEKQKFWRLWGLWHRTVLFKSKTKFHVHDVAAAFSAIVCMQSYLTVKEMAMMRGCRGGPLGAA